MTRLLKLNINWQQGKQYTSSVSLGGRHNNEQFIQARIFLEKFNIKITGASNSSKLLSCHYLTELY